MSTQDMKIIPATFPVLGIGVASGKLATKANIEIADPWHYQAEHNSSP
jgi:hypothetical protein